MVTIESKEKYFILNGVKYYFSPLDKIDIFHGFTRTEFIFCKNNKNTNSLERVHIPPALAQKLINMFHVQVNVGANAFIKVEIK